MLTSEVELDILKLDLEGLRGIEIADRLQMHRSQVYKIMASPEYKEARAELGKEAGRLVEEAREKLARLATRAVGVVEEVLEDLEQPGKTRLDAAKLVLTSTGVAKEKSSKPSVVVINQIAQEMSTEEAEQVIDGLIEAI